jgi:hypothetical protein
MKIIRNESGNTCLNSDTVYFILDSKDIIILLEWFIAPVKRDLSLFFCRLAG